MNPHTTLNLAKIALCAVETGCRDMASLDFFKEQGIDCYFSGCLTLTIPKQEKTEDAAWREAFLYKKLKNRVDKALFN